MKIIQSIDDIYQDQLSLNTQLKDKVLALSLKKELKEAWFFAYRLKSKESFALKIETGRVEDPKRMEDFFGCIIAVENINEIEIAIQKILKYFEEVERRPPSNAFTYKESNAFPFDDLRLYVRFKKDDTLPPTPVDEVVFEIQIKTFLQHAWTIATHDLIYKSDKISWARERVAYQIKAMLEQAEISISGVDKLSELPELAKENIRIKKLKEIQDMIKRLWAVEDLPKDILRLSNIISDVLKALEISCDELSEIIQKETNTGKGTKTRNLSPYGIIIQSIINQASHKLINFINKPKTRKNGFKVFIPSEIELKGIDITTTENVVQIK